MLVDQQKGVKMGTWHTSIKAVPGIGVFDNAEFTPPDPDWVKPSHTEYNSINRCQWCNIIWGGETVDNPMSGPEIPWANVELLSIDATNPTTLYHICLSMHTHISIIYKSITPISFHNQYRVSSKWIITKTYTTKYSWIRCINTK